MTAISTAVLAAGAIVTAYFAARAFGKQAQEVPTLEQEAKDQRMVISQQGELLQVQSGQLEVQRQQLEDQRRLNEKQTRVLNLQARDLEISIDQRSLDAAASPPTTQS